MQTKLEKQVKFLELDDKLINFLNENSIYTVEDIWKLKRTDLKKMGVKDSQINQISIKLQLMGLDLNKKVYNGNR